VSSPITASVLFPVDNFRQFIQHRFRKPRNSDDFNDPHEAVRLSFPQAGIMVASYESWGKYKRVVKSQNIVLVGRRLRFRAQETKQKGLRLEAKQDLEINCIPCGELPGTVLLHGFPLSRYFGDLNSSWCLLDITDRILQLRGVSIVGTLAKQDAPGIVAGIGMKHDDDFLCLIHRRQV
jgi:hypothetical protein